MAVPGATEPRAIERTQPKVAAAEARAETAAVEARSIPLVVRPVALARPSRRSPTGLGWAMFVIIFVGLTAALLLLRDDVVARWPPSADAYAFLGLAPAQPGAGLEVRGLSSVRIEDNGMQVLKVTGTVINLSAEVQDLPVMKGTIHDSEARAIQNWTFIVKQPRLLPNESIPFETRLPNPPDVARGVSVTFTHTAPDG
ncbi:MAG: hypothetical protein ACREGL_01245 [Alphaproteobacteria bacterium]